MAKRILEKKKKPPKNQSKESYYIISRLNVILQYPRFKNRYTDKKNKFTHMQSVDFLQRYKGISMEKGYSSTKWF